MISKTERVWRHLLASEELEGRRRYDRLQDIADELDIPVSTVHKALARPAAMEIVRSRPGGGLRLLDPTRLTLLWAGVRDLRGDVRLEARLSRPAVLIERELPDGFILGGFGAVVARLQGNRIADYDRVICYGDPDDLPASLVDGDQGNGATLTVLEPDPLLAGYGRVTPLSQAFVDLFNTPGWPAARFVEARLQDMARAA